MNVLLDTHVLIWWFDGGDKLSASALRAIQDQDNAVHVSAASAWEIAIKTEMGKFEPGPLVADFAKELEQEGFGELPIFAHHAIRAGLLKGPHKDPFDRMLVAQAQSENFALISKDKLFDRYGVRRIW